MGKKKEKNIFMEKEVKSKKSTPSTLHSASFLKSFIHHV